MNLVTGLKEVRRLVKENGNVPMRDLCEFVFEVFSDDQLGKIKAIGILMWLQSDFGLSVIPLLDCAIEKAKEQE